MAYVTTTNEQKSTLPLFAKVSKFLKNVGNSFMKAQEARARLHVKQYLGRSYKPF